MSKRKLTSLLTGRLYKLTILCIVMAASCSVDSVTVTEESFPTAVKESLPTTAPVTSASPSPIPEPLTSSQESSPTASPGPSTSPSDVSETTTSSTATPTSSTATPTTQPLIEVPDEMITRVPDSNVFRVSGKDKFFSNAASLPDGSKITLSQQSNGYTRVEGGPGALPGAGPAYVVSPNTGYADLANVQSDGSFIAEVIAPPGSWVIVKYDPTEGGWLNQQILWNTRPAPVNAASGLMLRVPHSLPTGPGTPFVISGSTLPQHIDLNLSGTMNGTYTRGGEVTINGIATVYPHSGASLAGESLNLSVSLAPTFDANGEQRTQANQFYSTILTPTGLPVEHWMGANISDNGLSIGPLVTVPGTEQLEARFAFTMSLPDDLPDGTYSMWVSIFMDSISTAGTISTLRPDVNPFMSNHGLPLPPFTVGTPESPRLVWTLLTDVISTDGSRGTVALEDSSSFEIANRIATQSHRFVIPRVSSEDGAPISYRLEPYLPMVAHGDRYIPNVPNFNFEFPSGSLTVQITAPDGSIKKLGPKPFTAASTRTPASSSGDTLDDGGGHLAEVFQLTTESKVFDHHFTEYGKHIIEMSGTVEDAYGNVYSGGGTYQVYVAESLDIEPATLPMTPFEVGDYLNPGVTVLPGVPADVEVKFSLYENSDSDRLIESVVTGKANRFGIFAAPLGTPPIKMQSAGEFLVETTASYTDTEGVLWMGATRWGQVVAPRDSSLVVHGRRGTDAQSIGDARAWFISPSSDPQPRHINLPFFTGDILWQTDDDAARVILTVQDTEGQVDDAIRDLDAQGNYSARGDHSNPRPTLDDRSRIGELPLTFATSSGLNPALAPDEIITHGYWYGGVERPGERVREIISDDDVGTGYWRFNEAYALQPGMGPNGDLPNDFKFMFGGAVFRDAERDLNRYGIYNSLWVQLPNRDFVGSRVFPPFQGATGGPSGGPIMAIAGEDIDGFVVPLAARPGSIFEPGDPFSYSALLAPTLPGTVEVTVTGPNGFKRKVSGRANSIGYFYDPIQDFLLESPGVYHVAVQATFDTQTSAGPTTAPFPTGTVLGAINEGFDVYVVSPDSAPLGTAHPSRSYINGVQPIPLLVGGPGQTGQIHFMIGMPGHVLQGGTADLTDGWTKIFYDPVTLSRTFPNIDADDGTHGPNSGLADTVWINMLLESDNGTFTGRQFTLQGSELLALTPK